MSPVIIVHGLNCSESTDRLGQFSYEIQNTVAGVRALELKPEQVTVHFQADLNPHRGDITLQVTNLFSTLKRTESVRTRLAERLKDLTRIYFPQSGVIECSIHPFDRKQGFAVSAGWAKYSIERISDDFTQALFKACHCGPHWYYHFFELKETNDEAQLRVVEDDELQALLNGEGMKPCLVANVPRRMFCSMDEFMAWREKRILQSTLFAIAENLQDSLDVRALPDGRAMMEADLKLRLDNFFQAQFGNGELLAKVLQDIEDDDFQVLKNEQELFDLKPVGDKLAHEFDEFSSKRKIYGSLRAFGDKLRYRTVQFAQQKKGA